jgi:simple sugar transport system ATP-binding protein
VLIVRGLSLRDAHGIARLDQVSLSVHRGEIVGVAGVEGNGQSELSAILAGMTAPTEGRFSVNGIELAGRPPKAVTAAGVGVVPEDRLLVASIPAMSLAENLFLNRLGTFRRYGMLDRTALRNAALELMRQFDVRAAAADAPFSSLSGGNQQKAILGRELGTPELSLLVAAQPTRGLDVGAVEAIYGEIRAACARGVGILLISSELDELLSVADRIIVLYRGRVMGECPARSSQRARIGALMAGHVE